MYENKTAAGLLPPCVLQAYGHVGRNAEDIFLHTEVFRMDDVTATDSAAVLFPEPFQR